jgi:hypothetical protein
MDIVPKLGIWVWGLNKKSPFLGESLAIAQSLSRVLTAGEAG